jgi:uncharacterized protein YgiM (DUF1202 family)
MSNQNSPKNDLPDWLRGDDDSDWEQSPSGAEEPKAPATPPPANRPSAPPAPADDELPPWLAEETDEDAHPVVDDSGKLSKDFLAKADQLADRVETELTYDQWIALQRESGRKRDIEEEIPDLLSDAAPVDPTAISDTGQLPDWFLGLEELDTSDAPEWFTGESRPSTSSLVESDDDDVPPWLAGMEAPPAKPPTKSIIPDELPPLDDDPLSDFFTSSPPPPNEEQPPEDWISELPEPPGQSARRLQTDWLSGLDLGEAEELPQEAAFEDELPADDWLTGIGNRAAPDVEQFQTVMLPEHDVEQPPSESFEIERPSWAEPEPEVEPLDPRAEAWLNELEGIVGFTHQLDTTAEEDFVQPDANDIDWGFDTTSKSSGDAMAAQFDWAETEAVPNVPIEEEEENFGWLNAATSFEEEPPPEPERPAPGVPDKPVMLTGMLSRFRQPEPPPVEEEDDTFEPPQMPDFGFDMVDDLPKTNPFGDVEHELRRDPSEPEHMDWESVVRSQALPDSYFELLDEEKERPPTGTLFDVNDDELESSWLAEQLLSEETLEASTEAVAEPEFDPAMFAQTEATDEVLDEPEFNLDLSAFGDLPPNVDNIDFNFEVEPLPEEPPPETSALPTEEVIFGDLPDFDYLTNPTLEAAEADTAFEALPDYEGFVGTPPPVSNDVPFTDDLPEEEVQTEAAAEDDMDWLRDELFSDEEEAAPAVLELPDELPDLTWEQPEWDAAAVYETTAEDELPDFEQAADTLSPSERWALEDEDEELTPWDTPPEIPADDTFEQQTDNPLSFLDDPIDEFRDFDRPAARAEVLTDAPEWLSSLEPGQEAPPPPAEEQSRRPFVMPLEMGREIIPEADNIEDLDSYLASLTADEIPMRPETGRMLQRTDVDEMLEEPLMPELPERRSEVSPEESPTLLGAEWLDELKASVSDVSAGAIVRQRKDRPVEDLPERLQKLRAQGDKINEEVPAVNDSLASLLPSTADALPPAPIKPGVPTFDRPPSLTADQQLKAELLGSLAVSDAPARSARMSAVEMTYDSPYFTGLEETESSVVVDTPKSEAPPAPRRKTRTRARIRLPFDRWLIAAALLLAVLLPFVVPALRIGDLPPGQFPVGSREAAAFDRIEDLRRGEVALIGVEYGSSAAAEMDGLTDALVRHILLRGAYPVLVGGNPIGLLRAGNLIDAINADTEFLERVNAAGGLQPNRDYYLVRYLPGGALGLRAFSADTAALLLTDINGQATGLNLRTLQDFSLIAVVADNAEDVRAYAEQIAPLARQSLLGAVSYSAAPLVEPFLGSGFTNSPPTLDGLLVGYADSYTYQQMLAGVNAVSRGTRQTAPVLVGPDPTPTPPPQAQVPDTAAPAAESTAEATVEATPEAGVAATSEAGESATAEPRATAVPRSGGTQTGVIQSNQSVNMRGGPGTRNPIITTLRPGTEVTILGENEAGDWLNVRLEDGTEGWVSAALVQVEPQSSADGKGFAKPVRVQPDIDDPTSTPRPSRTPVPTEADASATPEASPTETATDRATARPTRTATESSAEVTDEAEATDDVGGAASLPPTPTAVPVTAVPPPPPSPGYRDERWYAMTLGIVVSAFIIALGALLNIGRGLLRRR